MDARDKITRIDTALSHLAEHESRCTLCPRECAVDRRQETGFCGGGRQARVSHGLLHFGEEPRISGTPRKDRSGATGTMPGSGTIFFSGCGLKCRFCQNHQLSWENRGEEKTDENLADLMLELQEKGAANLNLVSPAHLLLPILRALRIALNQGFHMPVVYNTHAYEKASVLRHLEGIVDIYLPDIKYHSPSLSQRLSRAGDYFEKARFALTEMFCQQPVTRIDRDGLCRQGLLVRHLVLPGQAEDSLKLLRWLAHGLSQQIGLSLMSQYCPCHDPPADMRRSLELQEYQAVLEAARSYGFAHLYIQPEPFSRGENLIPDFRRPQPFHWDASRSTE